MLAEANRADEAVELLKLCVQKDAYDPENFNFLGVAYYKKGDFANALENYRKALELDHNHASVFNNIGSIYLRVYLAKRDERAYRLAMDNFTRAIAIDPRLFAAYNSRGAAYKFKNQVDKAIDDWKKTIEINPNFIDAYFNIGISYLGMGDKVSALKYFQLCKERFSHKLPPRELQRLDRLIAEASR
jgi:Flp pilus assembly protein TadD